MQKVSVHRLRTILLGDPVSPWRLVPLVAVFLWLPESVESWGWRLQSLGFMYYQVAGVVVWLCCTRLDPMLVARGVTSRLARLLIGAVVIESGAWIVYILDFDCLGMPLLVGRVIDTCSFWQWGLHVSSFAMLIYGWHVLRRETSASDGEIRRIANEMDELAGTLAEAELALLEAQIEPHFLFNTLAHVKRDLKHAPRMADDMLGALIAYLERAAPALRREDWTIADELDLVAVYLSILQQRFGERLRFSIDAPEPCRGLRLPALAVATLVENAVKHGLAPQPHGGTVRIQVEADAADAAPAAGAALRISVVDDGVGLQQQTQGNGIGLATVRARLRAAFGARAMLTLEPRSLIEGLSGVRASIRIAHA